MKKIFISTIVLGCLLVPCSGARADTKALGLDGSVYAARVGPYGELFPDGQEEDAGTLVVALDVLEGTSFERFLVPGIYEAWVLPQSPTIWVEDSTNAVYVLWISEIEQAHSQIHLTSFSGDGWSETIEITGRPYSFKIDPVFSLTRDTYVEETEDGGERRHMRTLIHMVWREEIEPARESVYYAPLLLVDGAYFGGGPVYELNPFDSDELATDDAAASSELYRSATIQAGRDHHTVIVAFGNRKTGRVVTLEIRGLPGELSDIAGKARARIAALGLRYGHQPGDIEEFAESARARIAALGLRLHPVVKDFLADQVQTFIIESELKVSLESFDSVADQLRDLIIDFGASFGFTVQAANPRQTILEIPGPTSDGEQVPHLQQIRLASSRPLLHPVNGDVELYPSRSGRDILVAWQVEDQVKYVESRGDGWSNVHVLELSDGLDLREVHTILEQRALQR